MNRLLVIDGNSIINRAFYGVKALTTKDGRYTNALVGFLNILARLRELSEATHIAVALTAKPPPFGTRPMLSIRPGARECRRSCASSSSPSRTFSPLWV